MTPAEIKTIRAALEPFAHVAHAYSSPSQSDARTVVVRLGNLRRAAEALALIDRLEGGGSDTPAHSTQTGRDNAQPVSPAVEASAGRAEPIPAGRIGAVRDGIQPLTWSDDLAPTDRNAVARAVYLLNEMETLAAGPPASRLPPRAEWIALAERLEEEHRWIDRAMDFQQGEALTSTSAEPPASPVLETTSEERHTWRTEVGRAWDMSPNDAGRLLRDLEATLASLARAEADRRRLEELLSDLAAKEAAYRLAHDTHGDGHIEAGLAWDHLRRAGNRARAAIRRPKTEGGAT